MTQSVSAQSRHPRRVIISGYGIPGRFVAEFCDRHQIRYVVIERNPTIVLRCQRGGTLIIEGDSRDAQTLRDAGIDEATDIAVTLPDDIAVLDTIAMARRLKPSIRIIARATYVSGGMEATKRGADDVVVAEQVVAEEFARQLEKSMR